VRAEVAGNAGIYLYVFVTTSIAFTLFGYVLGRQTDRLHRLSVTDALTGLFNRRALNGRLRDEYNRARRYSTPLSLLLVDVDGLKQVNDRLGHDAGDGAIRSVAEALRTTLRETDIGGRWGGDEFLIIAPNTISAAAYTLAERLRSRLANGRTRGPRPTVSIGVATFLDPTGAPEDPKWLVESADAALHAAKAAGRDHVAVA
jgi:diguanylate cyclase (GGDEF)-like protein